MPAGRVSSPLAARASKGGPTKVDRPAQPSWQGGEHSGSGGCLHLPAPHKKRVGAKGVAPPEEVLLSGSEEEGSEDEGEAETGADDGGCAEGLGGRSSGVARVERQVPVRGGLCWPLLPRYAAHGLGATGRQAHQPPRVATVQPPRRATRVWGGTPPPQPHAPAVLTRVGRCEGRPALSVQEGTVAGRVSRSVLLAPFRSADLRLPGQPARGCASTRRSSTTRVCVVTTFAHLLGVCPSRLYSFLLTHGGVRGRRLPWPSRPDNVSRALRGPWCGRLCSVWPLTGADALTLTWFPPPDLLGSASAASRRSVARGEQDFATDVL